VLVAAGAGAALAAVGVFGALKLRTKVEPVVPVVAPAASAKAAPACPDGMVRIQAGNFFMGSDDKEDFDFEKPAHKVTLTKPYCMDVYEVTTEAYKASSDAGDVKRAGQTNEWDGITASEHKAYDPLCNVRAPEDRGKHPINCVTWEMADAYCKTRKKRLPTEAEWEFAARGPDGRKYPWGDELPSASLLNACGKECMSWAKKNHVDPTGMNAVMYADDDGFATTAPVGSFPAGKSRYGVQDVVGNVWEWVSDWYAPYTNAEVTDPKGPDGGDEHVIRGGAWNGAMAAWVRPTFRYHDTPAKRSHGIGFRCAMSL
jgi:formylglycine-generating enzyme required for sulfatase activity